MLKLISNSVLASEIADFLGEEISGQDIVIYGPANFESTKNNTMVYIEDPKKIKNQNFVKLSEVLFLVKEYVPELDNITQIVSREPLKDFLRIVEEFFTITIEHRIHERAVVEEGAEIGENVRISANSYIGADVVIEEGTIIWENVVIKGRVKVGKNCVIKSNSTIGSDVFNFVLNDNHWEQFPQIGEIIIGDDVWVGANTSIEKGTMGDTIIRNGCRIDDLVQIGSNSVIGKNSLLAAGSIISRDVKIGDNCILAPNVTLRDKITIGENVTIGLGAVVVKNIIPNITVVGNPAKELLK